MDSEDRNTRDRETNKAESNQTESASDKSSRRTLDGRAKFHLSLLFFILIVGTTILGVAVLRQRLIHRTAALYTAIVGNRGPVTAEIGDDQAPYPEEYKRPEHSFPNAGQTLPNDWMFTVPSGNTDQESGSETGLITPQVEEELTEPATAHAEDKSEDTNSASAVSGLEYSTGEAALNAYVLLLETYPKVAEMVEDGNPALHFQSWGGVQRDDNMYWVRLIFKTDEGLEVEYIWQVNMQSKQVLPLSHNARTIS